MMLLILTGCSLFSSRVDTDADTALLESECGSAYSNQCVHRGEGVCFDPVYEPVDLLSNIDERSARWRELHQRIADQQSVLKCHQTVFEWCDEMVVVNASGDGDYVVSIETDSQRIGWIDMPSDEAHTGIGPTCSKAYRGPVEYERCAWEAYDWLWATLPHCNAYPFADIYCDMEACTRHPPEFP